MVIKLNDQQFEIAYRGFIDYVSTKDDRLFTTFGKSRFLVETELDYKQRAFYAGQEVLKRSNWDQWRTTPGKITHSVLAACQEEVSSNLLEHGHKFGPNSRDYRGLENLREQPISEMDTHLYKFLKLETKDPETLAPRFDQFSAYLSTNRLGCPWRFLTYLVFLLNKELYFPVLTTSFDKVMQFHDFDHSLTRKKVVWTNYQPLLDFAAELRDRLWDRGHAPTSLVDVHTYIYLLGHHILPEISNYTNEDPNWEAIMAARKSKTVGLANKREEIGLQGEKIVFDTEKKRLFDAGRPDLAERVRYVAEDAVGYDVASFRLTGEELYIEVKTTSRIFPDRFWLTNNERRVAKQETNKWTIYRVFLPENGRSTIEDIGNVVISDNWYLEPDGYIVKEIVL